MKMQGFSHGRSNLLLDKHTKRGPWAVYKEEITMSLTPHDIAKMLDHLQKCLNWKSGLKHLKQSGKSV